MVVLIEGYCFMDFFSPALLWLYLYSVELAQRLKLCTVAYAVDADELRPSNEKWAGYVASKMDLLMTRTEDAAGALRRMGVDRDIIVTADTAFTVEPASSKWVDEVLGREKLDQSKPVVGIAFEEFFWWPVKPSLIRWLLRRRSGRYKSFYYHTWTKGGRLQSLEMKKTMARFADWAADEYNANIAFFAMERVNIEPCRDVMHMMTHPAALFDADTFEGHQMTALLRRLKFLVTSEYHALLLSMGAGIPAIGLGHDARIRSAMAEIGTRDEFYIHSDEPDIGKKLREMSLKLTQDEASIRALIASSLPIYLERMDLNAVHFERLINERFPL